MRVIDIQPSAIIGPNAAIPVLRWKTQVGFPSPAEDDVSVSINVNTWHPRCHGHYVRKAFGLRRG